MIGRIRQPFDLIAQHGLLGRYFVGQEAGFTAPHLVRIDPQIDFDSVAELGAMPFPSVAQWTGELIAPRTGVYRFSIDADDAGWLSIDGRVVIPDPGQVNRPHATGLAYLIAGRHRIMVAERNLAGDASIQLYWRVPGNQPELVPSAALIPETP